MPRYRLVVAYDGTDFCGWQRQELPDGESLRSVQRAVEEAVRGVVREPITVKGASRTDSGVHAVAQCAAFTCEREDLALEKIFRATNARLPEDAQVLDVAEAARDFNPIRDAVSKGYAYRLAVPGPRGAMRPLFDRRTTAWTPYRLDPDRMNAAAARLVGEHDFASFTRLHHGRESTVRPVHGCRVLVESADRLRFETWGGGFLHNMVRIIVGTLIEVGRGRIEPEAIDAILAARDRTAAGPTAPAQGLCLEWIAYPHEVLGVRWEE